MMPDSAVLVENLHVRYGEREALSDVTLRADSGSFVAVIGPNGSGKTTLMKAILGLVTPSAGRVQLFGRLPVDVDPLLVGYVPQVKTLERTFPALSLELVVSGARRRWPARIRPEEREAAMTMLERVGAAHLAGRSVAALSGGELQRVFLARGLMRRPQLVMLDEPATGIDVAGAADLYELLEAYQAEENATVFMVTHDWNVAYHHASHVLLLNRRQISFGRPEDVIEEQNLRRAFGHVGHAHGMLHSGIQ